MTTLAWIIVSSLLMSSIALVGSVTLLLKPSTLKKLLIPLVAFAAGSLLGGAFLHMIPAALKANLSIGKIGLLIISGFTAFFILEQFLHWRHTHQIPSQQDGHKEPLTYLILFGDGLHNFLGGMAIAGTFLIDIRLGIASWLAAAAHEVPQELGDFAVLADGGWSNRSALFFNFLSGLTFLLGGLIAYFLSFKIDVSWLIPFAAGNFIYIGASDLIPKVNNDTTHNVKDRAVTLAAFVSGIVLLYLAIP
ncbi:ZIP family metal transporter [uncultured Paraglaciecola sp.]|uniref:ZIP family metal transporter n=1 Tax=uncultured Paraglaciecola sp. TaxID=1765024 RepID=UPI0030D9321A|tara:strand:- start:3362 stop:4108 length:747 start_codon:yes stop_codon:yes gene_type:complete